MEDAWLEHLHCSWEQKRDEDGPHSWAPAQEALQFCGAFPDLSGGCLRYARTGKSQNGNGELQQESTPLFLSLLPVVLGGSQIIRSICLWWIHESFAVESMFVLCTLAKLVWPAVFYPVEILCGVFSWLLSYWLAARCIFCFQTNLCMLGCAE